MAFIVDITPIEIKKLRNKIAIESSIFNRKINSVKVKPESIKQSKFQID